MPKHTKSREPRTKPRQKTPEELAAQRKVNIWNISHDFGIPLEKAKQLYDARQRHKNSPIPRPKSWINRAARQLAARQRARARIKEEMRAKKIRDTQLWNEVVMLMRGEDLPVKTRKKKS